MNSFGRIMDVVMREYMFRLENINRVPDLQVKHMDGNGINHANRQSIVS